MKFSEIISRLNNIGTPFISVGWIPKKADAAVARKVIRFLEDRRMLFNACAFEDPRQCALSAIEIRRFLTEELAEVTEGSDLHKHLAAVRAACRTFLDHLPEAEEPIPLYGLASMRSFEFFMLLGELRSTIGQHVALMAAKWKINVENDLARVLPSQAS